MFSQQASQVNAAPGRLLHRRCGTQADASITVDLGIPDPADMAFLLRDVEGETLYMSPQ
jgi:hypothetical protein